MGNIVEMISGISAPEPVEDFRLWRNATASEHAAFEARRAAEDAAKDAALGAAKNASTIWDEIEIPAGPFQGWKGTVVAVDPLTVKLTVFGKTQDYVIA